MNEIRFPKKVRNGNSVHLREADSLSDTLAPGIYDLQYNEHRDEMWVDARPGFKIPEKVYGDAKKHADRITKTFDSLGRGYGVLLSGEKGTGKTLTAKMLAIQQVEKGTAVINIDFSVSPARIGKFLEELNQPCVILIDEFEKTFVGEFRTQFLSVLDGMRSNPHLWVLTSNDPDIGEYFSSRPSRIRYHFEYDFLSEEVIEEIVHDHVEGEMFEHVMNVLSSFVSISFDSLMSILEEANLYHENPTEFMEFFNVKPEAVTYTIEVEVGGLLRLKKGMTVKEASKALALSEYAVTEMVGTPDSISDEVRILIDSHKDMEIVSRRYTRSYCNDVTIERNCVSIHEEMKDDSFKNNYYLSVDTQDVENLVRDGRTYTLTLRDGREVKATMVRSRWS